MTNSEELYTGEDFEITEMPTEAEVRATRIALLAAYLKSNSLKAAEVLYDKGMYETLILSK